MSRYWIKLYHELLRDPKMGRLPDHLWRRSIELFLIAGQEDREGRLPSVPDMAWSLHTTAEKLNPDLLALDGIVIHWDEPEWVVTKFAERQDPDTDAERKRHQRDYTQGKDVTKRDKSVTVNGHEPVQELKLELKIELEQEAAAAAETDLPIVIAFMGQSRPREDLKEYTDAWIEAACEEALRSGGKTWGYVEAILKRWHAAGRIDTSKKSRAPGKYADNGDSVGADLPPDETDDQAQRLYDLVLTQVPAGRPMMDKLRAARPVLYGDTLTLLANSADHERWLRERAGRLLERSLAGIGEYKLDIQYLEGE